MKISIIIPNYNGKELLKKNLPSVIRASLNTKNNISEIIIVDDGSEDTSVDFLTKNYKNQIKLIKHTKNRGFSSAVNTGVRSSYGDLIVLLNTDVTPSENFLEDVIPLFSDEKVFSVSFHERGYGFAKGSFDGYVNLSMGNESKKVEDSFYANGGSAAFRKSTWKDLGGLDENLLFPYYWEDVDLCYRASKRGYQNLWAPDSDVTHQHESTISKLPSKNVVKIRERNQLLFIWKNIHSLNLIKKHVKEVILRTIKHPGYLLVVFSALLKINIVIRARKKELKECKVSDEAVFQKYS